MRIEKLPSSVHIVPNISFGHAPFLELLQENFDVYAHHGAWTNNYRSLDYKLHKAFQNNTHNIKEVMEQLAQQDCKQIIVSSSIFEGDTCNRPPISPHGLAKKLTSETFFFYANLFQQNISRFVIPNPFGPLDNPKLIHYLATEWFNKRTPTLKTPLYIRDNIPVDLLAYSYVYWLQSPKDNDKTFAPSGYVESMKCFAQRVSKELSNRLSIPCPLLFSDQRSFAQPKRLINPTKAQSLCPKWNEQDFWEALSVDLLLRKKTQ